MLPDWLRSLFRPNSTPRLKAIFIATGAGSAMQSVPSATAIRGRGLRGDRYHDNTGHWQFIEGCQVTLITAYELKQAQKRTGVDLSNGSHRRNLVIEGINPRALPGRRLRIGTAVFEYEKPRPPCGYLDQVAGRGIGRALSHNSGICARIIASGELTVGDALVLMRGA